jgi:hypothetical protein
MSNALALLLFGILIVLAIRGYRINRHIKALQKRIDELRRIE